MPVHAGVPDGVCPATDFIRISAAGQVFPCCTPGWPPALLIGNARERSIAELLAANRHSSLLRYLREVGPGRLLQAARRVGDWQDDSRYVNVCHLCQQILTTASRDPAVMAEVTREVDAWLADRERRRQQAAQVAEVAMSFFGEEP